jgi:cellobiose PTS system EIIA component
MALEQRFEDVVMGIIANAGAARSAAFEALTSARKNDFANARKLLIESEDYSKRAHERHTELLACYASGELQQNDLLVSHAQDHLMCSELARELISELIDLRELVERK